MKDCLRTTARACRQYSSHWGLLIGVRAFFSSSHTRVAGEVESSSK